MKLWAVGGTVALLGSALTIAAPHAAFATAHHKATARAAHASPVHHVAARHSVTHHAVTHPAVSHHAVARHSVRHVLLRHAVLRHAVIYRTLAKHSFAKNGKQRFTHSYGGISCVPFARAASGIDLKGNAATWWDAASGVYQRGSAPEIGSVLNFRATGRMPLGHVAVITSVINAREVDIDHANWAGSRGSIARSVAVMDVSTANDWSEVRVGLGHGEFGSVYPTYGFIYDRPDRGTMQAKATIHPKGAGFDEVAEAPAKSERHARYIDAPNHSLR